MGASMSYLVRILALLTGRRGAPILSGVVGLCAGILLSNHNSTISTNRFFLERQVEAANSVVANLSTYVENWRRLIALRRVFETRNLPPSEEEQKRLFAIADARNQARDRLFSALDSLSLYYDGRIVETSEEFRKWDELQAIKELADLPEISEWKERARPIIISLRGALLQ